MEELFENTILNELYETRRDGFESLFIQKYGTPKEIEQYDLYYNNLTEEVQNNIKDYEKKRLILEELENFEEYFINKMTFWEKQYYKLGFSDAYNLKIDAQIYLELLNTNSNKNLLSILLENFSDFFENYNRNNLYKTLDYIKISEQIKNLKSKYPKVRNFLENSEIVDLSNEEQKIILKIIKLEKDLQELELKEAFKIGLKQWKAL